MNLFSRSFVSKTANMCFFQVLADNKLGTEGGKALSEMLINNKNIYKIDLTGIVNAV